MKIDKERVSRTFTKAASSYEREAIAQRTIAQHLMQLLVPLALPQGGNMLEIGCGTGILSREIVTQYAPTHYTLNDICAAMHPYLPQGDGYRFVCGDAEQLPFLGGQNLIASSSTIQWFADPATFVQRMEQLLAPQGVLALTTFGTRNLYELTSLTTPSPLAYPTLATCTEWLSSNMEVVALEEQEIVLRFDTAREALAHLKQSGVNATNNAPLSPRAMRELLTQYTEQFSHPDGGVTLTYHPIYLVAVKK